MRFFFRQHMDVYIYETTDHNGIMRMQPRDIKSSDTLSRHVQQDYNMAADRTSLLLVFFPSIFFPACFLHIFFSFISSYNNFEISLRNGRPRSRFQLHCVFCPIHSFIISLFLLRNIYSLSFFFYFPYFLPRFIICLLLKKYLLNLSFFFLFYIRYELSFLKSFNP